MSKPPTKPIKPVLLYDHLPGILAGYPALLFAVLAGFSYWNDAWASGDKSPLFDSHMMFWIGASVMLVWYIAFRFNMPKSKFWLIFGLFGTFVGIPVVLEISGMIKPFQIIGNALGKLAPEVNTGAWIVFALIFTVIWLANLIYSRTHLRVRIDESGLTINRLGGKGERFELIGLKTENEPLDYLELFMGGIGSLSLKTRMNKPIFSMKRVVGLYRIPWFPFFRGKLARVEEILSFQGKVVSVEKQEQLDVVDQMDAADEDAAADDDAHVGGEFDENVSESESPEEEIN